MLAQPIPVPRFQAEREEPARGLPLAEVRPAADSVSVRTGPNGGGVPAVLPRATIADPPVQCLLVVEDDGEQTSLTLPMRSAEVGPPGTYYLETPRTVRGLRLAMRVSEAGQGTLQFETNYTGLDVSRAASYARFVAALKRRGGRFTVSAYVDNVPLHLVTMHLPLPFSEQDRKRSRQELRFWEALHEVADKTGTKLICPPEITDADLKGLNVVLGAVRNGWVVEKVKNFTMPPTEETAVNLLRTVEEGGGVLNSLALLTEHETYEIFGSAIDLGKCVRHFVKARMLTPTDEIRAWLAADPIERGDLTTLWEPVDGAHITVLFHEWPKGTPDEVPGHDIGELLSRKGAAPLHLDAGGTVRAGGTRVTLDSIAAASGEGEMAREIADRFPALSPDDLGQILGWYVRYRGPVDAYLARREDEAERFREEMEARFETGGLRERLLARRGVQTLPLIPRRMRAASLAEMLEPESFRRPRTRRDTGLSRTLCGLRMALNLYSSL